ncbi:Tim44/TimA family putative adaptor protein [Thalassovita sp.]|uniref:Tim44/TimA family putative adaptor protein n=1 Tax=Thalassovita sp. TaxID=1979401 RepID=UPI002AB097B9|nr:Tim44/TimA family putative adaptor protein [Thalassovita sp.]
MDSTMLQTLVLVGIAIFLVLRLRNVLGTREGFEKPVTREAPNNARRQNQFEVIEGGPDRDITDHVAEDSDAAKALAAMKRIEPGFGVADFIGGARSAYEWILMGFERGDLAELKPFLDSDVYESFAEVIESRNAQGLSVEAEFIGVREVQLLDAEISANNLAEITVRFVGEMTSVVRDNAGDIIEGKKDEIKRQKDVWTFARQMGSDNPNWQLVATGE